MAVVWAGHAEVTGGQGWLPAKKKEAGTKLSFRVSLAERWDAKVYAAFILFPQRGTSRGRVVQLLSETTIHLPRLPWWEDENRGSPPVQNVSQQKPGKEERRCQ